MTQSKPKLAFVDQAVSFGGSLKVAASLCDALAEHYQCHLLYEVDHKLADSLFPNLEYKKQIKQPVHYEHWETLNSIIAKNHWLSNPILKRLTLYTATLCATCLNFIYVIRLAYYLKKHDIDLVHINNSFWACLSAKLAGKPFVWHFHGHYPSLSRIDIWLLNNADGFISISGSIADSAKSLPGIKLCNHRIITNPLTFMPSPLSDQDKQQLLAQYGLSSQDTVLAHFGRIIPWKGQYECLKACIPLLQTHSELKILFVGQATDGHQAYLEKCQQLAKQAQVNSQVIFTGYTNEVAKLYQISDIILHSSIDPEPFGLVITEAMICKKPVIASSFGAPTEIIEDQVTGTLADPRDSNAYQQAIASLIAQPEKRSSLGLAAYEKAMATYHPSAVGKAFHAFYQTILSKSSTDQQTKHH